MKRYPTPSRYLRNLASRLELSGETIGLMTAVPMTQLVTAQTTAQGILGGMFCDGWGDQCGQSGGEATPMH